MQDGTYIIFLGTGSATNKLCLGTRVSGGRTRCVVARFDENDNSNTWVVVTLPGTDAIRGFYLQHQDSQLFAHFGNGDAIYLDEIDPDNMEYFLRLDISNNGQVAINNHSDDLVMDANGAGDFGANVSPYIWNEGSNQKWRFVSTAVLASGSYEL